jgi:hypothetical protein
MENENQSLEEIFNVLYTKNPQFHGREKAGSKNYAIRPPVLKWIIENIPKNSNTLETGCGYSTVILTAISKQHTVISPFLQEHQLIRDYCEDEGMSTNHVVMIPKISQDVLPQLQGDPLDFILIDGDHAFPAPFIDWYYTADRLKEGGYLAVDDTHIPTGKILKDFLIKENSRWTLIIDIGNTSIFKRITSANVARDILFIHQAYCQIPKKKFSRKILDKLIKIARFNIL